MAVSISLINNLSAYNLINQTLNKSTSAGSLGSLLTSSGSTSLLSSSAKSQQAVNLNAVSLMTASGQLTSSNPLSVFSGSSTQSAAKIEKAVTNFVSAYNKTVTSLSGSSNPFSQQGAKNLTALAEKNATALSAIGITIDNHGKLVTNTATLHAAATSNQSGIKTAFNGASAFASKVTTESRSAVSQSLGLNSGAGFMALYSSSLSSGASNQLSSSLSRFNSYL